MLMQARAVPGGQHFALHGEASTNGISRDTLNRLEGIGCVECFESRDGLSQWNLAPAALKEVLPVLQLCSPEPVLKTRINLPLKDRTAFELLSIMNSEGWTWQRRHPKQVAPPYAVADREPKVFYTSGIGLPEVYGRCLLDADRLGAQGVTHIEHGQVLGYYKDLWDKGKALLALEGPRMQADLGIEDGVECAAPE